MNRNKTSGFTRTYRNDQVKTLTIFIVRVQGGSTRLLCDRVFFSSDYLPIGSQLTFPGGCGILTLGQLSGFKMAAKMASFLQFC